MGAGKSRGWLERSWFGVWGLGWGHTRKESLVRRISPDSGLSRESVKATERLKYNWTLPGEC